MNGRLTTILVAAGGLSAAGLGLIWTAMNQTSPGTAALAPDRKEHEEAGFSERRLRAHAKRREAERRTEEADSPAPEPAAQEAVGEDVMVEVSGQELGASSWMEEQYQTAYLYTGPRREKAADKDYEALARPGTPASLVRQEEILLRDHPELANTIERNRAERQALVEHGEPEPPRDL
jgi:hypothetical protein